MARKRFEMFQYRQTLVRMRQGDSDRQIATARIVGRRVVARLRELGEQHHWLDAAGPMPPITYGHLKFPHPERREMTCQTRLFCRFSRYQM